MRVIVAITGASGIIYAIELLKALKEKNLEIHLIISKWAEKVMKEETNYNIKDLKKIANYFYYEDALASRLASSSFIVDAMIIIPASVKTIADIANAYSSNLISRAADNMLKCKRKLIIAFRETPLSSACIHNLYRLSLYGAIILPLAPALYHKPKDIKQLINFITSKILDLLNIENDLIKRWDND